MIGRRQHTNYGRRVNKYTAGFAIQRNSDQSSNNNFGPGFGGRKRSMEQQQGRRQHLEDLSQFRSPLLDATPKESHSQ